jgi:hypothetical protein
VASGVIALLVLLGAVVRRRQRFGAVMGPLACLGSVATLALAVGYARGSALDQRYVVLGATLIVTTYVCLRVHANALGAVAAWSLFLTSIVVLPWNAYYASLFGQARRAFEADLVRDVRDGVSIDLLGARYYRDIWGDPRLAIGAIKTMHDDRLGPFQTEDLQLNESPPFVAREEPLSVAPVAVHNMSRAGDYWQGTGADSYLLYAIDHDNVAGVRLKYSLTNSSAKPAYFQLTWSDSTTDRFDATGNSFVVWGAPATSDQEEVVAWIGKTVSTLRVTPDFEASSFKLDEMVLLFSS